MTAIAVLGCADKNTALMTTFAAGELVGAEQRKPGLTVIKFFVSAIGLRMSDGR